MLILSACYLFVSSCSNDFELTDDWKDIAIVYGLLNPTDTAHYVKVTKAFLDASTSSLVIAQIPDSLYYQNVTVELKELSPSGGVDNTFLMDLVDANNEGFPKPEGVFADSPNLIYKTKQILDPSKVYRLNLTKNESGAEVTAETGLIDEFEITRPQSSNTNANSRIKWAVDGQSTFFRWVMPDNAAFYDLTLEILYEEAENNAAPVTKKLIWELEKDIVPNQSNTSGNSMNMGYDGIALYQYLNNTLESGSQFCRKLLHFNVKVHAGGEQLFNYINAGQANTGLTSTLPLPNYTNLSGENRGILSTRASSYETVIKADGSVFDELMNNPLTADMGWVSEISNCN